LSQQSAWASTSQRQWVTCSITTHRHRKPRHTIRWNEIMAQAFSKLLTNFPFYNTLNCEVAEQQDYLSERDAKRIRLNCPVTTFTIDDGTRGPSCTTRDQRIQSSIKQSFSKRTWKCVSIHAILRYISKNIPDNIGA